MGKLISEKQEVVEDASAFAAKMLLTGGATFLFTGSPALAFLTTAIGEAYQLAVTQTQKKRISNMFQMWQMELSNLSLEQQEAIRNHILGSPEEISNLIELASQQAAKSRSDIKILAIAKILASGFKPDTKISRAEKYISVLESLDELDLAIICEMKNKYETLHMGKNPILDVDLEFDSEILKVALAWNGTPEGIEDESETFTIHGFVEHSLRKLLSYDLIYGKTNILGGRSFGLSIFGHYFLEFFTNQIENETE